MSRRPFHVLVYGDVDLNLIDGSSVWLQSVVAALHHIDRVRITVQLKRRIERETLAAPLRDLERVELIDPPDGVASRLEPKRVPGLLAAHDERLGGVDAVLLRGFDLCQAVARDGRLAGRLWCYVTDFPQDAETLSAEHAEALTEIGAVSRLILCQTPEMRTFLEAHVPALRRRTAILPPLVPDMPDAAPVGLGRREGARIIYAGKFCRLWRTEELVAALPQVRAVVGEAELVVVGDKIHHEADDPGFRDRMKAALEGTPGVAWRGAMSREEVQELIATADFGVSLRDPALDTSLELSTKVLEYGRAGVPPILSRTAMHERLLGNDYPLFVDGDAGLAAGLLEVIDDDAAYDAAARAAWAAAREHTLEAGSRRLRAMIDHVSPEPVVELRERRHVLVAGHDLKFAEAIIEHLRALPDVEVRTELWTAIDGHDESESARNLEWSDAVLAEWCLGNAVWYGARRRPGQRVTCRFHLVERETDFPDRLRPGWLDHMVFVGAHVLREMRGRVALDPGQLSVIPNAVPTADLQRPKLPGAPYNLGIVGISPMRKRLDWAVEALRLLRLRDERFVLFVKGRLPPEYPWVWQRPAEREFYLGVARRINADPLLAESVIFDGFDADIGDWYRKLGFILSTSDFESHHLGLAEGIASGAVPLIRDWDGAAEIYPDERLVSSPEEAAQEALRALDAGELEPRQRESLQAVPDRQAADVCRAWERLLLGPSPVSR